MEPIGVLFEEISTLIEDNQQLLRYVGTIRRQAKQLDSRIDLTFSLIQGGDVEKIKQDHNLYVLQRGKTVQDQFNKLIHILDIMDERLVPADVSDLEVLPRP